MVDKIEPFGLMVRKCYVWDRETMRSTEELTGGWQVHLPHMCDRWTIAGRSSIPGASHEEAVAALEAFVAEAQAALVALKAHQEFGKDD
jgi:hypothetical protein